MGKKTIGKYGISYTWQGRYEMVQRHEVLEITIDNLVPTKWVRSGSNYEIVTFETIDAAKSWIKEWTTEEKSESDTINEQYFLDGEIDNRVDDLE